MSVVDEATLVLAPERARQALATTTAAVKVFFLLNDRRPSDDAMASHFLLSAREVNCTTEDIEWLIAAGLLPADILGFWTGEFDAHNS